MRYSFTKFCVVATLAVSFALSGTVLAAPAQKQVPVLHKIVTSDPYVRAGKDKFSLHVEIKSPKTVKKTDILVDGKVVKTCKIGVKICEVTVGPYTDAVIGEHIYTFTATSKNGMIATQWGKFWVTDPNSGVDPLSVITTKPNLKLHAHNKNGAGVLELLVSKKQFVVGEKGTRLLLMRGSAKVESISYVETVDGIEVSVSEISGGTYSSGTLLGPFADKDVGEHEVKYTIVGKNGKELQTALQYWVVPKGQTLAQPVILFP